MKVGYSCRFGHRFWMAESLDLAYQCPVCGSVHVQAETGLFRGYHAWRIRRQWKKTLKARAAETAQ